MLSTLGPLFRPPFFACQVVVLENEILYGEAFPISEAALDKDFTVPLGKAKVRGGVVCTGFGQLGSRLACRQCLWCNGIARRRPAVHLDPCPGSTTASMIPAAHRSCGRAPTSP